MIDLVCINYTVINYTKDVAIQYITLESVHFSACLQLSFTHGRDNDIIESEKFLLTKLDWNLDRAVLFTLTIQNNPAVADIYNDIETLNNTLLCTFPITAIALGLVAKNTEKVYKKNPWYDKECRNLKRNLNKTLRLSSNNNFPDDITQEFFSLKKITKTLKTKKLELNHKIIRLILKSNSSRFRLQQSNNISLNTWFILPVKFILLASRN